MKANWLRVSPWLITLVMGGLLVPSGLAQESSASSSKDRTQYICPPCGCSEDGKVFDKPGVCSDCFMVLTPKLTFHTPVTPLKTYPDRPLVVILLFEGVQIIDYTGPYEVFGQAGFEVTNVAPTKDQLQTYMGMKVTPNYDFATCPTPDIFVIPGGGVDSILEDKAAMEWVRKTADASSQVLSVCNGAFILADTGLLDGHDATTFFLVIEALRARAPKVNVVNDKRYVDNGKFITTAGLTSGLDGSFYLVSKLRGRAWAQTVAFNLEYDWEEDQSYARASFADRLLVNVLTNGRSMPLLEAPGTKWEVLSTKGDRDYWEIHWQVAGAASADGLQQIWRKKITTDTNWRPAGTDKKGATMETQWRLPGAPNGAWQGVISAEPGTGGMHRVSLRIKREQGT